ncbi:MAG: M18 family aminopeptidase [Gammaproteobacteria bacterium]
MTASTQRLLQYLTHSPTPYHAVTNAVERLESSGFTRLDEDAEWGDLKRGKYFVTRNDSSLVAFGLSGSPQEDGFRLVGAHTDSPCLKVKPNAISESQGYSRLALEVYGGALLAPWFDRDLGLAGRITYVDRAGHIQSALVKFDRAIGFIPSLAIHLDRNVNQKRSINKQNDLPALLCRVDKKAPDFSALLKQQLKQESGIKNIKQILGFELSLYDLQGASLVGLKQEFVASARLDNLLSCHAALEALISTRGSSNPVIILNDHEEVGSASTSGAEGPLLLDTLGRICGSDEKLKRALSHSMLVSADNAHGVHPNYADKHEPAHRPMMNDGPVIKINHNQRYATNSETEGLFRQVCAQNKLPVQTVVVRSDMGCGSTIGPITATRLGVRTVDVGVPQLGMHSVRELAGAADHDTLVKALKGFFKFSPWPF